MRTIENATRSCCQIYPSIQNFRAEKHIVSHLGAGAKAAAEATRAATIIDLNMMKKRCICGNYVVVDSCGKSIKEKSILSCEPSFWIGAWRMSACKIKKKGRGKKRELRFHPFNSNRAFPGLQKLSAIFHPPQMMMM